MSQKGFEMVACSRVLGGDSIAFNFIALIIAPDSSKYYRVSNS